MVFSNEFIANVILPAACLLLLLLALILAHKMDRLKQAQLINARLKKSLDEMDEQAKLIVRTDMELNKTQEELDKKVNSLYALQELSRLISTTLEVREIFKRIDAAYLAELGFEKACAFLWSEPDDKFLLQTSIGYSAQETETVKSALKADRETYLELIKTDKPFSSIPNPTDAKLQEKIKHLFSCRVFVLSPIAPKEGARGFLFVGTLNPEALINEGDEELITILTHQISQAIDNARLFEKTWGAQQELEKKVEERTSELSGALEEVNIISKRKTDFISSVSHELRTPLTSIKGYASILLAGKLGELPKEVRERLEKVNKHSDELVHLVNELLDIARIESGRMPMKMALLDLKDLLTYVSDLLAVQIKQKHIDFSFEINENAQSIFADRSQIQRVLINLIGNAIKFTPQNGSISLRSSSVENMVQIDIQDNGCGIPLEAQEKIFEEFYRVENPINEEVKGTGLGLALVKHIVEAHRGKIWVKSKLTEGSTFSFTLPKNA